MLKKLIFSILFVFIISPTIYAQEAPIFHIDTATFAANERQTYVEIYYKIPHPELTFREVTEKDDELIQKSFNFVASFQVEMSIIDMEGNVLAADTTVSIAGALVEQETISPAKSALKQRSLYITPGEYKLTVKVTDLEATDPASNVQLLDVTVSEYEQNGELTISDIELASFIRQSTEETPFYKGGYEVLPNPSAQFGDIFPNLYFYYEIYNFSEKEPNTFDKTYQILDSFDNVVKEIPGGAGQKSGKTSGQIWRISVNDLPEGDYTLKIIITDDATEKTAEQTEPFSIFNYRKKPQPRAGQLTLEDINRASGENLEEYLQGIKYIATKEELKALKKVESETEKKEFLTSFWKSRNQQRMNDHYNLVNLANREFETFNKKGWETDMGRVFVKYGKPNDIERHPMEFETPAHQIWRYYELKGYFIFADLRGFGDFTLVDSNVPGEVSNPDWLKYSDDIIKGGKGLDEKGFE